jgi:cytochrome P450
MPAREAVANARVDAFPLGAAVTVDELDRDPHPVLARLREHEPVSWLPALDAWYVTRRDLALTVLRDAAAFTVDDPRFSTGQVVGRSMLSTDGDEHARHRAPFARQFRLDAVRARFAGMVAVEVDRLIDEIEAAGTADLRRSLAGPLAVASMIHALGLAEGDTTEVLSWYETIVAAVTDITAGKEPDGAAREAVASLRSAVEPVLDQDPSTSLLAAAASDAGGLTRDEVFSNTAVLLFGGIETTEGMIANSILHLLSHPGERALVEAEPGLVAGAVEESMRLEPSAAVVDRYATRDVVLGDARVARGDLVTVSIAGANRDPLVFEEPDRFTIRRPNSHLQLAFAQGPHVCLGMHLARVAGVAALDGVLDRLPGLRLDPDRPSRVRGLVFRKPETLHAVWG